MSGFYLCLMEKTTELRTQDYGCCKFNLPRDGTVFDTLDALKIFKNY